MSNVSNDFCGVVGFFFLNGILSRKTAERANSYIQENIENLRDYGELFTILDTKTGKKNHSFDSRETALFLDFCFANDLQNIDKIPALFLRYAQTVSRGTANRIADRRGLRGSDRFMGVQYYSDAVFTILSELAYCSTEWQFVRFESIRHEVREIPYNRVNHNSGMVEQDHHKRTVFIINENHVVQNSERAKLLLRDSLRCVGSWVAISPSGELVIPCFREKKSNPDTGEVENRTIGIDPTFSFLRIVQTVASNSFFTLELGPQSRGFEPLSAELADSRRKAGYRETLVDEFEIILNSEKFSTQEKNVARSLSATFDHKHDDGVLTLCGLRTNGIRKSLRAELFMVWFENYCAVANTRPHLDHFRKMVKNFKRHVQRFFSEE
jgi:hypothetical protein